MPKNTMDATRIVAGPSQVVGRLESYFIIQLAATPQNDWLVEETQMFPVISPSTVTETSINAAISTNVFGMPAYLISKE
jgi:hypothetical protein